MEESTAGISWGAGGSVGGVTLCPGAEVVFMSDSEMMCKTSIEVRMHKDNYAVPRGGGGEMGIRNGPGMRCWQ